jgi:hypothetical protein
MANAGRAEPYGSAASNAMVGIAARQGEPDVANRIPE